MFVPFAFAFASEQKSDNSSFFRMKNEKPELSSQEKPSKNKINKSNYIKKKFNTKQIYCNIKCIKKQ
jgi:hypothetical protein